MRPAAVVIVLMVLLSIYTAPASAPDVILTVEKEQVRVKLALSLHQNMTQFPNQTGPLNAAEVSDASRTISQSMKKGSPAVGLSDLTLDLNSTRTWLNLTATMNVSGVSERKGDILAVDSTWKAFNVSADLRAGNLSYNAVGIRYLRPVVDFYANASKFESNPNATIKAVTFFMNETQSVAGEEAANQAGNFTVFDFRSLDIPLEQWNRTYNVQNNTTNWRYAPPPLLGMSVRAEISNKSLEIFSEYSYSAEISVPGLARAEGQMVYMDVGTGQKEWVMAGVVIAALVLAVVSQFLLRARRKAAKMKRK